MRTFFFIEVGERLATIEPFGIEKRYFLSHLKLSFAFKTEVDGIPTILKVCWVDREFISISTSIFLP